MALVRPDLHRLQSSQDRDPPGPSPLPMPPSARRTGAWWVVLLLHLTLTTLTSRCPPPRTRLESFSSTSFLQLQLSLTLLLHTSPSFLITTLPVEIPTLATSLPQHSNCTSGPRTTLLSPVHVPPREHHDCHHDSRSFFFLELVA